VPCIVPKSAGGHASHARLRGIVQGPVIVRHRDFPGMAQSCATFARGTRQGKADLAQSNGVAVLRCIQQGPIAYGCRDKCKEATGSTVAGTTPPNNRFVSKGSSVTMATGPVVSMITTKVTKVYILIFSRNYAKGPHVPMVIENPSTHSLPVKLSLGKLDIKAHRVMRLDVLYPTSLYEPPTLLRYGVTHEELQGLPGNV
jgi:hypothetical protein